MDNIIGLNTGFNFNEIALDNPYPLQGGNFYTKLSYTNTASLNKNPLHLQLSKCKTKNGIVKNNSSRKSYCDLMFSSHEADIISWMENLENRCRELIYSKKDTWFQTEMSMDDIENIFISPTRSYKSGKCILIRAQLPSAKQIKKDGCLIYDEHEQILEADAVDENTNIIPLVTINGIKFSSKSFQLDILLSQIMVLSTNESIKTECLIKHRTQSTKLEQPDNLDNNLDLSKKQMAEENVAEENVAEENVAEENVA